MEAPEIRTVRQAYESVVGPVSDSAEHRALLAAVAAAVSTAQATHPTLQVPVAAFVARIARVAGASSEASAIISDMFAADLWLAEAALGGDRAANQLIEDILRSTVQPIVQQRVGANPARVDEIMQLVRVRMLVGDAERPAKLGTYAGRGSFAAWARVVAVRVTYNLLGETKAPVSAELEESLVQAAIVDSDSPELQVLLTRAAPLLKHAMQQAVAALPIRERTLLRLSLVDALSIDEIGAIYDCHRATAARWVASAKDMLADAARTAFCTLAQTSESEFLSVMRALPGYFDVSMERLLVESSEPLAPV